MPQATIDNLQILHLGQNFKAGTGDLGAAVEVDGGEAAAVLGEGGHGGVCHAAALADVKDGEPAEVLGNARHAGVRDGAGRQGEGFEVGHAAADVRHARIGHPVTEGHVESAQRRRQAAATAQEADADVADVVAGAEVELDEAGDPGQRLETGVGDAEAEAEVEAGDAGQALRDVTQRLVRHLLTVLQTELLKGPGTAAARRRR